MILNWISIEYIIVFSVCIGSRGVLSKLHSNLCIYNSISSIIIKKGEIVDPKVNIFYSKVQSTTRFDDSQLM